MILGVIGKGRWGNVYARTIGEMGLSCWQIGKGEIPPADGVIIATPASTHFRIAAELIDRGIPVLIEKPVCLSSADVRDLLFLARMRQGIVFTGHTRLYSPAWRAFKANLPKGAASAVCEAGGPCKIDPWWDWGPHLVSMCLDLGLDPAECEYVINSEKQPIKITVGDSVYVENLTDHSPLEVLISEFVNAIAIGAPNVEGLELGVKVVEMLESDAGIRARATTAKGRRSEECQMN
jgi:predicted dehydrogenase